MRKLAVLLLVMLVVPATAFCWGEEEDIGTVTGKLVLKNGEPMSGAMVFLFDASTGPAPMLGKFWRVPDVIGETDESGQFFVQARQGRYYLGAIKRMSDANPMGPPVSGDYVYPSHEEEAKGKQKAIRAVKWETTNVGIIRGIMPFDRDKDMYRGPVTAIEGTVLLPDGKPAEHAIVFAYDNPELKGNPRYASDPSEKDGKYTLRLGKAGTYYLRVRGIYGGGRPTEGSLMGGGSPSGVRVTAGKTVRGIDIIGGIFAGRGEQGAAGVAGGQGPKDADVPKQKQKAKE